MTARAVLDGSIGWYVEEGEALALLKDLPSASVDAVVTDQPYSSGGAFRGDRMDGTAKKYVTSSQQLQRPEFTGDNRDQRAYGYWCALWLAECLRVAKPGAPICLFSDWRQLPITSDALQAGGWIWRGVIPWDKITSRPQLGRFRQQAEFVLWGSSGPFPVRVAGMPGWFRVGTDRRDKHHQTGKPVDLMRQLVRICPAGGVVLDPFAGSGSTLVGALCEGRRAIGFELVSDYVRIARSRCRVAA